MNNMYIKEILKYNFNYAEYKVTDGNNELICMCVSVPLLEGKSPEVGMIVSKLYAFMIHKLEVINLYNKQDVISIKKGTSYFEYTLTGRIIHMKKSLVKVNGFTISLEYEFQYGLPVEVYKENDMVIFTVDRLDSELKTT